MVIVGVMVTVMARGSGYPRGPPSSDLDRHTENMLYLLVQPPVDYDLDTFVASAPTHHTVSTFAAPALLMVVYSLLTLLMVVYLLPMDHVLDLVAHGPEPFPYISPDAGVDHRHAPIFRWLAQYLYICAIAVDDAVAEDFAPISEKEFLDGAGLVSEAQREVAMPE